MERLETWLHAVYDSALGEAMRENALLYPWIEAVHVLALTVVIGSIVAFDLRLLGLASVQRSVRDVMRDVLPATWIAFVVAVASGFLLFASNAVAYAHNGAFQWKLVLLALLGLNAAVFHAFVGRRVERWEHDARTPWQARVAGLTSVSLWVGVTIFGRWIGFTINALP